MIKPEQVPDNVEEHFLWCAANTDMTTKECIAAALNAWLGMWTHEIMGKKMCGLPLFNGNKNE